MHENDIPEADLDCLAPNVYPMLPGADEIEAAAAEPTDNLAVPALSEAATLSLRERLTRRAQSTYVILELGLTNEAFRLGVFAASQTAAPELRNAIGGAVVYGGITGLVEGGAALATAEILSRKEDSKVLNLMDALLTKVGLPEGRKVSGLAKTALFLLVGSPATMYTKDREEPGRSVQENRRYGLRFAAWGAGICAVQGAFMGEGVAHPDPKTIGLAIGGVVGIRALGKAVFKRLRGPGVTAEDAEAPA